MIPKIIKTEKEYKEYSKYIESTFHRDLSREEANNIEVITVLLDSYDRNRKESASTYIDDGNVSIDYIYDLVKNVSPLEKNADIIKKILKLGEEYGELSAEILKLVDYKYNNDSKEEVRKNLFSETIDCLIMILDILNIQNAEKDSIVSESEIKIEKWLNQINKK